MEADMWYNQRLWSEEEMAHFLKERGDSTDALDMLVSRAIASALVLLEEQRIVVKAAKMTIDAQSAAIKKLESEVNKLSNELDEYEAKRYYTQCRINEKDKRIKELEDFLNETQARIRGALRTEKP
jgi:peptidoglycan hydrolase CwlO-like protein